MEKMLQSLLRLRCQTFLEKTYLKNSALNPRTVRRHGCASPQLCDPAADVGHTAGPEPLKCSEADSTPNFRTAILFSLQKWRFFSTTEFFMQARVFSAAFYCSSSGFGGNAKCREAVGTSTEILHPSVTSGDIFPVVFLPFPLSLLCGFCMTGLFTGRLVAFGFLNGKRKPQTLGKAQAANPHDY